MVVVAERAEQLQEVVNGWMLVLQRDGMKINTLREKHNLHWCGEQARDATRHKCYTYLGAQVSNTI